MLNKFLVVFRRTVTGSGMEWKQCEWGGRELEGGCELKFCRYWTGLNLAGAGLEK